MKILIVDDSRVMRQIVTRTLRQAGYSGHELVEATDGYEGLQAVQQHGPDLVLSDWNMPEMTGIELLQALRAQGLMVPFGFVTSEGSPEMVTRAADAGALFVITKPFTAETFRDALDPVVV
ncbi:MAG: response regulator [Nocardioidaceae bacterium]